jgi:hypothetical protein
VNKLRLIYQHVLSVIAKPLGFNHRLTQFCDRCGKTNWGMHWWDYSTIIWEAVAGNVNGHHHGCFCPPCFTALANEKGLSIVWRPAIEGFRHHEVEVYGASEEAKR